MGFNGIYRDLIGFIRIYDGIPSGKRLHSCWKSPCYWWENQRTKWTIFNSELLVYQSVGVWNSKHDFTAAFRAQTCPDNWKNNGSQPDDFPCAQLKYDTQGIQFIHRNVAFCPWDLFRCRAAGGGRLVGWIDDRVMCRKGVGSNNWNHEFHMM